MKQGRRAQKFISSHWWTYIIWKMPNWRQSTKNTKVELGFYAVFTEQGSSASQVTAARVMNIISRLSGCARIVRWFVIRVSHWHICRSRFIRFCNGIQSRSELSFKYKLDVTHSRRSDETIDGYEFHVFSPHQNGGLCSRIATHSFSRILFTAFCNWSDRIRISCHWRRTVWTWFVQTQVVKLRPLQDVSRVCCRILDVIDCVFSFHGLHSVSTRHVPFVRRRNASWAWCRTRTSPRQETSPMSILIDALIERAQKVLPSTRTWCVCVGKKSPSLPTNTSPTSFDLADTRD